MKKFLLGLLLIATTVKAGPPFIFNGDFAKNLAAKGILNSNDLFIRTGSADPTSVATLGAAGSLYQRTTGQLYIKQDAGTTTNWSLVGYGTGTVTSVALAAPTELSVSGSPVTSSGTLTLSWASQAANKVFAGPTSGGSAPPAFRSLVSADIPSLPSSSTLTNTHIFVGNGSNVATDVALSGDATLANTGALTLATVASGATVGSSTSIPTFTFNNKGLVTSASGNAVIAPAGTLTGSTLASGVTASSLTSVGTLTSGTWNATTIDATHGGTAQSSWTTGDLLYASATNTLSKRAIGSTNNALIVSGGIPTWSSGTLTGSNSGDITLGSFGSTPATEGASLSGQVLTLQPADATHGGGVSTGSQTFAGNKTFSAAIQTNGQRLNPHTITFSDSPYTMLSTDDSIWVDTSGGNVSVTLVAASTKNQVSIIKKTSDANTITINRAGSDTINGSTSIAIADSQGTRTLNSDGISLWNLASTASGSGGGVNSIGGLTASAQTFAVSYTPATGGSSISSAGSTHTFNFAPQHFRISLPIGSAEITGASSDPVLVGQAGTNANWTEAQFNDTTVQNARFVVSAGLTKDYAGGQITCKIKWRAASTSGAVVWTIATRTIADGVVYDTAYNSAHSATTTVVGTTLQANTTTIQFTPSGTELVAGDTLLLQLQRNASSGSDTLSGDASVVSLSCVED